MILFLSSNITATLLLACAMLIYGWIYTIYLKRTSSQNIVIGGLAGALPPLIGWASVTNSIDFEPVILVAIIFLWTPPHFWALSIKKQSEYEAAGIPMLPNVKGITHTKLNILIYSIILIFSSFLPYYYSFATSIYCIIAILLGSRFIYLAVMLYTDPESKPAMQLFGFSIFYLFALFATLLIGKLLSI
jgi:protoheme IX farnesyltransferase